MNKAEIRLTTEISSSHGVHSSGVVGGRGSQEKIQNEASQNILLKINHSAFFRELIFERSRDSGPKSTNLVKAGKTQYWTGPMAIPAALEEVIRNTVTY